MSLLDAVAIAALQREFRQSMRMLLIELCQDIDSRYAALAERFNVFLNVNGIWGYDDFFRAR